MFKQIDRNVLRLIPLFLLYIIIVLVFQEQKYWGDEGRYLMYAYNLSEGSYLPNYVVYVWNGPGYPIILTPFFLFKLPFLAAKLMNAVFLYLAILFLYYTQRLYMAERHAIRFTYLAGLYIPFMRYLHVMMTETFTIFLVSGFLFYFCKLHRTEKTKWSLQLVSAGFLGYLALTKIIFGYVILVGLILFLTLYIFKRKRVFRKTFLMYLIALIFCLPYLTYTYSLTGKAFYWGHSGGMSLYWLSSPYQDDLGDWHDFVAVEKEPYLSENHLEFFNKLEGLSFTEMDYKFKKRAMKNIVNNPRKFFMNWIANVGRLLFNYPYSYTAQKVTTYFYIIPNMFLVVFFVLSIYPSYLARKSIPHEIYGLILFALVSIAGHSLVSVYNRQLLSVLPALFIWISFIFIRVLKVEMRR